MDLTFRSFPKFLDVPAEVVHEHDGMTGSQSGPASVELSVILSPGVAPNCAGNAAIRILISILGAAIAAAQSPPDPTFRAGTELIQVSVVAQDKDGKPVSDLRSEDFQIFDNGVRQDIRLFLVQKPGGAPSTDTPGVFTNRLATDKAASYSVVLFDNLNIDPENNTFEHTARAQVKAPAALRAIPPGDVIAVYALWRRFQVVREFTTDRDSILAQLRKLGAAPAGCLTPPGPQDQDHSVLGRRRGPGRAQISGSQYNAAPTTAEFHGGQQAPEPTLQSVADQAGMDEAANSMAAAMADDQVSQLADHLAGIPGRKNLIWLTTTFRLSPANLRKLINAGVAIYPVDTLGSTIALETFKRERAARLAYFAAATGGRSYTDRDDLDVAMTDALNDGRASYILGFYQPDESRQTPLHKIEIRLDRPDVTLRYRTSYTVEARPPKSSNPVRDVVLAMNRPVDATAIGIAAAVTHTGPGKLNVSITFDISNLNLELNQGRWTGTAEFVSRFETADGKAAGSVAAQTLTFHLKPATYAAMLQRGYLYREQLTIPAKAVELNLAMSNPATGKVGTVRIALSQVR